MFEEKESESETKLEQGQQEESESEEIEEEKKVPSKKRTVNRNNVFDYINQKDAKRHKQ